MKQGWYERADGYRVYVIGPKSDGSIAYEANKGGILFVDSPDELAADLESARHLPDCTGWDWKPAPPPSVQVIGQQSGNDSWKGLRLWTFRTLSRGDRYVFCAAEKGTHDWVELVFDGKGWQIVE